MLHNVVTVLVLSVSDNIVEQPLDDSLLLLSIVLAVDDQLLHHTEPVLVPSQLLELEHDVVEQLVSDAVGEVPNDEHDHVVAFDIFRKFEEVVLVQQRSPNQIEL